MAIKGERTGKKEHKAPETEKAPSGGAKARLWSLAGIPKALLTAATKDRDLAGLLMNDEKRAQVLRMYRDLEAYYTRKFGGRGRARRGLAREDNRERRRLRRKAQRLSKQGWMVEQGRKAEALAQERRDARVRGERWVPPWQKDPKHTRRAANIRRRERQRTARRRRAVTVRAHAYQSPKQILAMAKREARRMKVRALKLKRAA